MSTPDEKALEKQRRLQREANAFHRTFDSDEGKLVLSLLQTKFKMDKPAFLPPYDTHAAAIRDGQREVILYIQEVLKIPVTGDANITDPVLPVKAE